MKHFLLAGVLVLAGIQASALLLACGDKFGLPVRFMTFEQQHRARHAGSVVIYAPAGTVGAYAKVQDMLKRVGHRVTIVREPAPLAQTLAAGKTDIVLTALSQAAALNGKAPAPQPSNVFLLYRPTAADLAACRQHYPCLRTSDDPKDFVIAVNAAMDARAKSSGHGP